jgi:glycerophosphoryl diester phosphodiesterase
MAALLFHRLMGWVYATPLALFEGFQAREAMAESERRVRGNRRTIAVKLWTWFGINLAIRSIISVLVVLIAKAIVWQASGTITLLVIAMGVTILLVAAGNLISGVFANITLASTMAHLYVSDHSREKIEIPDWSIAPSSGLGVIFTRGRAAAIVTLLLLAAALLGISSLNAVKLDDEVEITAHRGGAFNAPENTMAAINQGIEDGADWIEIDVQESLDGVVVVIHDSDLMKVAGNPLKIWDATADQLRAIDIGSFFDRRFSDQRIPTLDEVLKTCRGRAGVNIELKYYGHDQDLERKVIEIVERNEMTSQIVVMSLEAAGVAKIKALRPDWTVGLLTAVVAGDLTRAKADFLAVKDSIATDAFVKEAHLRGKSISAWTLNDAGSLSLMVSRGVDNLITDRPALARRVLARRKAMSPVERLSMELAYFLDIQPEIDLDE